MTGESVWAVAPGENDGKTEKVNAWGHHRPWPPSGLTVGGLDSAIAPTGVLWRVLIFVVRSPSWIPLRRRPDGPAGMPIAWAKRGVVVISKASTEGEALDGG
ncbi:hypothetical protein [Ferrimicrobium sp.]|uniref:hypothetical protein n=1 Tax=Ferrimicrobium sp. TaxID=2926050 RepID=UPI0026377C93|nr:hypothetical protein [Ferrimicrobium sp.]